MIKFTASGKDVILVGLGLTPENITRMQAGQPIRVRLKELGFTGPIAAMQIMIFTGESEQAMQAQLKPFIGPDTVVHTEP